MSIKIRRGTYANVASTLGVALALGGTAYATTLVTSAQIQDGTIKNRDVHAETLTGSRIHDGTVGPSDLAPDARSAAYSTYHDANLAISTPTTVLTLSIPEAGSYVINAKAGVENSTDTVFFGHCQLNSEGDSDFTANRLDPHTDETVALQIVHVFSTPGTAVLTCDASGAAGKVFNTKITAVRVSSLTNTPS